MDPPRSEFSGRNLIEGKVLLSKTVGLLIDQILFQQCNRDNDGK